MEGKGEIRRLHIIYFLSRRMGRIDHPHLIRVHHLTRSGVYLRDIKRWLADLRGKDMPEAFAWSYKRRYKTGYIWQDLLDDDLITPISDNEYVLKGSEIISCPCDPPPKSYAEKRSCFSEEESVKVEVEPPDLSKQDSFQLHDQQHPKRIDIQAKVSPEINKQSSPHLCSQRSTLAHELDAMKPQRDNHSSADTVEPDTNYQQQIRDKLESSSFYSNFLLRKKKNKNNYTDKDSKEMVNTTESPSSCSSSSSSSRQSPLEDGTTKSNSRGSSSKMFRNLITCGAVDTNDSVVVMLNRINKTTSDQSTTSSQDIVKGVRICKGDHKSGGSAGVFGACRKQQEQPPQPQKKTTASRYDGDKASDKHKKEREFNGHKAASADYRPVGRPHCSQCRKLFEPEKLHSHMKSCRGMKALPKTNAASVERIPEMGSRTSTSEESASICFLTS